MLRPYFSLLSKEANMANEARVVVTLACTECKERTYATTKNKRKHPDRLELNKYCPRCRVHKMHREAK